MKIGATLAGVLAALVTACAPADQQPVRLTAQTPGTGADRPASVIVEGLRPGEPVRLWARATDREGQQWESSAEFTADGAGRVETTSSAATAGTYQGVDPHGLFWSMRLPPGQLAPYPLVRGAELPIEVGVDRGAETLARTVLTRVLRPPQVEARPVEEHGLVGDLYLPGPPGTGPWPGVLLLGGSEGGRPDPAYAAALAGHGYAVLGLAYFGEPGLPATLTRVPVEYGLEAVDRLIDRPDTRGSRIAVVGTSKGAEYALLLASSAPEHFAAVVSHVGSDVVWPALAFDPAAGPRSSWSRDGADVPFLGRPPAAGGGAPPAPDGPVRVAAAYAGAFAGAPPEQRAAARIPVERIAAPILLTSGGDDGIWPSGPQAQRLMEAVSAVGNPHGSRHLHFPRAGHFVGGLPGLPTTGTVTAAGPLRIESGGEPAANAEAVRRTWAATLELLEEALRG